MSFAGREHGQTGHRRWRRLRYWRRHTRTQEIVWTLATLLVVAVVTVIVVVYLT